MVFVILFVGMTVRIFMTVTQKGSEGRRAQEFFEGPFSKFITSEKVRRGLISDRHFSVQLNHFIPGFLSYSVPVSRK